MSGKATGWALDQRDLSPTTKLVLVALADECRRDGMTCFPSRQRIADCVGIQPRAVSKHIAELEERGLVRREERERGNGARSSNLYHLALDDTHVPGDKGGSTDEQGGPCPSDQGRVTEPTQKEPKKKPSRRGRVGRHDVTESEWALACYVLTAFNRANGSELGAETSRGDPSEHVKQIIRCVREYPQLGRADYNAIITDQFADPWWTGRAGPGVIFGPRAFPQAVAGKTGKARGRRKRFQDERRTPKEDAPW